MTLCGSTEPLSTVPKVFIIIGLCLTHLAVDKLAARPRARRNADDCTTISLCITLTSYVQSVDDISYNIQVVISILSVETSNEGTCGLPRCLQSEVVIKHLQRLACNRNLLGLTIMPSKYHTFLQ